jgi:hypothetical protein
MKDYSRLRNIIEWYLTIAMIVVVAAILVGLLGGPK